MRLTSRSLAGFLAVAVSPGVLVGLVSILSIGAVVLVVVVPTWWRLVGHARGRRGLDRWTMIGTPIALIVTFVVGGVIVLTNDFWLFDEIWFWIGPFPWFSTLMVLGLIAWWELRRSWRAAAAP